MNTKNILPLTVACLSLSSLAVERPNVVLIMTDDQGRETIGAHGCLDYKTPILDRMAKEGLKFNHCYSQPLCTPSRVKIMTGKYNFRNYEGFGGLPVKEKTFGHAMQNADYTTCIVGKWQLGGDHDQILAFGFDEYCLINGVKPKDHNAKRLRDGKERYWQTGNVIANGEYYKTEKDYGPDMVNEYACTFIKRKRDKPFFLYYPMILPHSPWAPTPHSKDGDKSGKKVCEVKYFKDNIEYIDHLVGNVLKALDESGQRENTIVMFTGDNGSGYATFVTKVSKDMRRVVSKSGDKHDEIVKMPGEDTPKLKNPKKPYMEGPITRTTYGDVPGRKNKMLRDGTGVPCIIDWPRYRKEYDTIGHSHDDLIDFSDFFATVLDVAGTKVDYPTDGISFAPRLRGKGVNDRKFVFCHYWYFGRDPSRARDAIHDQRWKLYNNGDFFDMEKDPNEKTPLKVDQLTEVGLAARARLMKNYTDLRALPVPNDTVTDKKGPAKKPKKSKKKKKGRK
jgi:arylsulfatase A